MPLPDLTLQRLDGTPYPLTQLAGKVVLVVNVASRCGFTPQYEGLETLYRELGPKGLVILGFPCNQFGQQEPGDADEIARFCSLDYPVTFPIMAKCDVNGE
ncbi:MAG: glutathione peroxidase, partial [Aeromonas veronii]